MISDAVHAAVQQTLQAANLPSTDTHAFILTGTYSEGVGAVQGVWMEKIGHGWQVDAMFKVKTAAKPEAGVALVWHG